MKTQILIALGAMAALSGVAHAQTVPNNGDGVQLKKDPFYIFPDLSANQPAGTRLRNVQGAGGTLLQIQIVRQDSGQALRQLATVMGVHIVIDPAIQFLPAKTHSFTFNAVKDDVFDDVSSALIRGEAIEKWKSSSGTYFFAAKSVTSSGGPPTFFQMPDGTYKSFDKSFDFHPPDAPLKIQPYENPPQIDPNFMWPKNFGRLQPLPNWENREFNGQPYYNMPLPIPGSPDETFSNSYVLPVPRSGPMK